MLDFAFTSIIGAELTAKTFILCLAASLALGLIVAAAYMFRNRYNSGFVVTLALLPAMVQMVIMMVNGNLGTGIAVMGAFSLVRFRSIPGSAREISSIFLAMSLGLATGLGYIGAAFIFTVIMTAVNILLGVSGFGNSKKEEKELKITIPEGLDYTGVFDDLFARYTTGHELIKVKTTNMGSLYKLTYRIELKDPVQEKQMIDELRCRNGNLEIACGRLAANGNEL